jgi:hypothetical protein
VFVSEYIYKMYCFTEVIMATNLHGLAKFCNETSLPGWANLNREIPKMWKALWAAFLLFILIISVFFLYQNTSQVSTTLNCFRDLFIKQIMHDFNSVTINCKNSNFIHSNSAAYIRQSLGQKY